MNLQLFDIKSYLQSRGIKVHTSGKNLSEGWIGIQCPWCQDKSNHMGINIRSKIYKCWVCKRKGPSTNIVMTTERCSEEDAQEIMEHFVDVSSPWMLKTIDKPKYTGPIWPPGCTEKFPDPHLAYLRSRNFIPEVVIPKYKLKACYNIGEYKFRIIIPIIMDNRVVAFTSRSIDKNVELRYKTIRKEIALMQPDHWVYNIDSVKDTVMIVEGPTDVWRLGDGVVSFLGTEGYNGQIYELKRRGIKKAIIMFDAEKQATDLAEKIGVNLDLLGISTEIVYLMNGDPAELSQEEGQNLKQEILRRM